MNRTIGIVTVACVAMLLTGCLDPKYKEGERQLKQPINCATAEGDIRLLQHEESHVGDQMAAGVTSIVPAAAVVGIVTGTEGEKLKIGSGDYNRRIDARIAEIKQECGLDSKPSAVGHSPISGSATACSTCSRKSRRRSRTAARSSGSTR